MGSYIQFVHADSHRACRACATAKTKCIAGSDGTSVCERCHRMEKECVEQPRQERKGRKKKTRQSVLEGKFDQIVALLETQKQTRESSQRAVTSDPDAQAKAQLDGSTLTLPGPSSPPATSSLFQDIGLTDAECAARLASFIQHQAAYCPWIEISADTTAAALRQDNPLLFLTIMVASSLHEDDEHQQRLGRVLLTCLADQIIVRGLKSPALVQGLLVLVCWHHAQAQGQQQGTNLLYMCIAMVVDLELAHNMAPAFTYYRTWPQSHTRVLHGARRVLHTGEDAGCPTGGTNSNDNGSSKTLDDRRLAISCWCVTSVLFTSSPMGLSPMSWAPPSEESIQALDASARAGSNSDARLVNLVRLQRITVEIHQMQRELMQTGRAPAPLSVYVRPFEARLEQCWADVPDELRRDTLDGFVQAYHIAYVHLYRISLLDFGCSDRILGGSASAPIVDTLAAVAQQELRFRCLRAAMACVDVFLALPPARIFYLPMMFFCPVSVAIVTLVRLHLVAPSLWADTATTAEEQRRFSEDGVDSGGVDDRGRNVPPVRTIIERVASQLERAPDATRAEGHTVKNKRFVLWAGWARGLALALDAGGGTDGEMGQTKESAGESDNPVPAADGDVGAWATDLLIDDAVPGFAEATVETAQLNTDWPRLLADFPAYGLFGLSEDDFFQNFLASGDPA